MLILCTVSALPPRMRAGNVVATTPLSLSNHGQHSGTTGTRHLCCHRAVSATVNAADYTVVVTVITTVVSLSITRHAPC